MSSYTSRLITPPEEEEIYPYRRVWRSIVLQIGVLFGLTVVLFILTTFVGLHLPDAARRALLALLALLPLGGWFFFSWFQEIFVPEPRQRLIIVAAVTALGANAVGVPLIEGFFQPDRWLPPASAVDRIVGYTFTVGIVHTLIKYAVLRFTVWNAYFRVRMDGIAYGVASAVGYATVLNLHYVFANSGAPPDIAAMRVFNTFTLEIATSILIGYGLSQVTFSQPTPLLLTLMLMLAALVTGLVIPVRAGLVNANLFLGVSAPSPVLGLGLSLAIVLAVGVAVGYLIENADRVEREAAAGQEV